MNILIVGNGFDLSHYLPTKYDHFMVAMGAIENWDEQKGEMGFDDLFGSLYEKENYFFKYTKAIYQTGEIKISVEKINNIKAQLKKNVWYQYFSDHMREVRTWIDFEEKINKALVILIEFIDKISIYLSKSNAIDLDFYSLKKVFKKYEIEVQENELDIATIFKIFDEKIVKEEIDPDLELFHDQKDSISRYIEFNKINISCIRKEHVGFSYFNTENFINELYNMLNKLISIFDFYLQYIVDSMLLSNDDCFVRGHRNYYSEIYSFNYTSTYKKYYNKSQSIDYLHGKLGRGQNIVLGVSDLNGNILSKYKIYGFTKYHQKLLKDTDYLFLDGFKNKISLHKNKIEYFEKDFGHLDPIRRKFERQQLMEVDSKLDLNIYIWGHSLDVSDKDYIIDLFCLNDDMDRNVRIIVYYFDKNAKFSLLNNLLAILGKDKVELWMKKGWLKFESNPNLVEINKIQPVDLPKYG